MRDLTGARRKGEVVAYDHRAGDIIKTEGLKGCYLIVSKNYFNMTEQAILCPIVEDSFQDRCILR